MNCSISENATISSNLLFNFLVFHPQETAVQVNVISSRKLTIETRFQFQARNLPVRRSLTFPGKGG